MTRLPGATRDEGGLSVRQLKNAAAEPPNRYDARHVPTSATNSRSRRPRGGGEGSRSPPSASTRVHAARDGRAPPAVTTSRVSPKTGPMPSVML